MNNKIKQNNIPDGWERKSLSQIGRAFIGLTYSPSDVIEKDGTLVLRSSNIKDGKIDYLDQVRVSAQVSEKNYVKEGDILICARNGSRNLIGKNAYIQKKDEGHAFGAFMSVFRSSYPQYVYQLFQSSLYKKEIERDLGPTINQVTTGNLLKFRFNFPPFAEQKRIVAVLETWDLYLEKLARKIEIKKNIKKGLMQQLLTGKKRLEGFKEKWKTVKIGMMGKVITGNTPPMKDKENYGGEYCWATADDFNSKYIKDTKIKLSDSGKNLSRWLPKGSLLITCIASIGKNAIAAVPLATNQQINAVIVNDKYNNEFLFYLLSNSLNVLRRYAGAGAILILNKNDFSNVEFKVPQKNEQDAIANILMKVDQEIAALEQKKKIIEAQKKFLLNNLVTGRIRTPENMKV